MDFSEILEVPQAYRDPNWENQFFDSFVNTKVSIQQDEVVNGPDGMAYLLVQSGGDEPVINVLNWLSDKGVGLVLNAKDPYPDYVFSWGMIWNFKQNGKFIVPTQNQAGKGEFEIPEGQDIYLSAPKDDYLPGYVRAILKEFWVQQERDAVKVAVMYVPGQSQGDLCFSLESLGNPPKEEHDGLCEAMSWFLPPHYSIVLMSEKDFPQFEAL